MLILSNKSLIAMSLSSLSEISVVTTDDALKVFSSKYNKGYYAINQPKPFSLFHPVREPTLL